MSIEMKEKIITESTRLFSQSGYDSIGINQIVQQCGVSKPTLYYYFQSKENLLKTIISQYSEILRVKLLKSYAADDPFSEMLSAVADAYLKFASEQMDFIRLYLSLIFTPHSNKAYQVVKIEAEQIQKTIGTIFLNESSLLTKTDFFTASFIGQLNLFATLILNGYIEYSKDLSKTITAMFLNGARSI